MIDLEKVKAAAARAAHKAVHGTRAKQFLLRLPDGIHERIAREAAANHRSMNAEIVYRLQAMRRPTTLQIRCLLVRGQRGVRRHYATKERADFLKSVIYTFSAKGLDIPLYKFNEWVTVMKDGLASALRTNTAETAAFCREHKQLVGKTARWKEKVAQ